MAAALAVTLVGSRPQPGERLCFCGCFAHRDLVWLSLIFGLSNTIVQERAPSHLRGRVSAVMGLSFFGLMPIAGLGVTSLADAIGMRTALVIAAVGYGVAAISFCSRIGGRMNDNPAAMTSPAVPKSRRGFLDSLGKR